MPTFQLTRLAEADLLAIADYTHDRWGEAQALRYVTDLETACVRVAARPGAGRACDELSPGLRRMEQGRHVIFYQRRSGGILVVRILHERMLPGSYLAGNSGEQT